MRGSLDDWLNENAPEVPPPDPGPPPPTLEIFDVGDEDGRIPPRQWLLGNVFCRCFLSGLIGIGGGGKTSLRIAQLLSLTTNRQLTGEHVFVHCRAMIVCLEDDMFELRRRVRAAMLHHGIEPADVKGRLLLTTPRQLKIAQYGGPRSITIVPGGLYSAIAAAIARRELDLVCIDPAIKAHAIKENLNEEMDAFVSLLADLATEKNIGIDLLSHERKAAGAEAGDINRGRGASSYKDALRLGYTLTGMTLTEAQALGVEDKDRPSLFRVDSAKVNIAPPSTAAQWFRLVGVPLENGDETYPNGDIVQAAEPWKPQPLFDSLSTVKLNAVLTKLGAGMGNGRRYSTAPAAKDRAAWRAVQEQFPDMNETRCRAVISAWVKNNVFEIGEYEDPSRRTKATGIFTAKRIGRIDDDE